MSCCPVPCWRDDRYGENYGLISANETAFSVMFPEDGDLYIFLRLPGGGYESPFNLEISPKNGSTTTYSLYSVDAIEPPRVFRIPAGTRVRLIHTLTRTVIWRYWFCGNGPS